MRGFTSMAVFSQRLIELRKHKNVYQKDIAEFLNISVRQYQSYESEKNTVDVPLSKLLLLADYFEVSLDYLTGRCDDFSTSTTLKIKQQPQVQTALKVARSKSSTTNTANSSPVTSVTDDFSDLLNATPVTDDDDL
jgi:transcriptional regulator with XRE-family HTH domain